jgi:hypothetical protein
MAKLTPLEALLKEQSELEELIYKADTMRGRLAYVKREILRLSQTGTRHREGSVTDVTLQVIIQSGDAGLQVREIRRNVRRLVPTAADGAVREAVVRLKATGRIYQTGGHNSPYRSSVPAESALAA